MGPRRNGAQLAQLAKSNSAGDVAEFEPRTPKGGAAAGAGSTRALLSSIAADLKDLAGAGGGPRPRKSPGA